MTAQHRKWIVLLIVGLLLASLACALPTIMPQAGKPTETAHPDKLTALPSSTSTVAPAPQLSAGGSSGGTGGSNGGTGGNSGGMGSSGSTGANDGTSNDSLSNQLTDTYAGPYLVKQIETLGGEAISGSVCSLTQPFTVLSITPHVTFTFNFVPQSSQQGNVSYTYSIPSAGESHDATGTYSLSLVDKGGTLQLKMSVKDHVVFKGFDGNIPNTYKFNLVPSENTNCPSAP